MNHDEQLDCHEWPLPDYIRFDGHEWLWPKVAWRRRHQADLRSITVEQAAVAGRASGRAFWEVEAAVAEPEEPLCYLCLGLCQLSGN